jgi:WD40 repeat protein
MTERFLKKGYYMSKKVIIRFICIFCVVLLSACNLQEVTPPVEPSPTPETSFVIEPTAVVEPTELPTPEPVEISAKNAPSLTVVNRSAVMNIQQLKWADDGSSLLISTQNMDTAGTQSFGVTTLSSPDLQPKRIYSTQEGRVADIASDGKKAVVVSLDMSGLSVIDLEAGNAALLTILPDYLINSATFSPDSASLALSSADTWEVTQYAVPDGKVLRTLTGFETAAPVYYAGFTEAPQWMVWWARATLQIQDIESGAMGPALSHEDFVTAYASSRDGSMLASIASRVIGDEAVPTVSMWDAVQGAELTTLVLNEPALCLDFSPNGSLLAVGVGNTLQIWDVTTGSMIASLEGHAGAITKLAFSKDGRYIATAGQDNQLYLWQAVE